MVSRIPKLGYQNYFILIYYFNYAYLMLLFLFFYIIVFWYKCLEKVALKRYKIKIIIMKTEIITFNCNILLPALQKVYSDSDSCFGMLIEKN